MDYQQAITDLRVAYSRESAAQRDKTEKDGWKVVERQQFLTLLQQEHRQTFLEIGAGTGIDALFFQNNGLRVTCTDLSPAMIELCREKGLDAHVMDFLSLDFPPASFEALYALNCLLHVPTNTLPAVLSKLQQLLCPGGLFFLGVYGAIEEKEGIAEHDWHNPPRFFARHTDEFIKGITAQYFDLVSFKAIPLAKQEWHFQALVLRRRTQEQG